MTPQMVGEPAPGCVVRWGAATDRVRWVVRCQSTQGEARWTWVRTERGSLLEILADEVALYEHHVVYRRGTSYFQQLAADDGALAAYDLEREAGVLGETPVYAHVEGVEYRVDAAGMFAATPSSGLEEEVWSHLSGDPTFNLFFALRLPGDESARVVGLWTRDIWVGIGRRLDAPLVFEPSS